MVVLAGILSPIPQKPVKEMVPVINESRDKIEAILAGIVEIVSPLSSVATRGELKRMFDRIAPDYLHLKNEVGRLIMNELSTEEFSLFARETYEELLKLARADMAVLGADDREILTDVVESLMELLQCALDTPPENQGVITDILMECSYALQRVNMCLSAIFFVLTQETRRWSPGAIKLLTHVAQEYMRQVEDTFLVHDSELTERLMARGQTVSLEEVRRQVGLRS